MLLECLIMFLNDTWRDDQWDKEELKEDIIDSSFGRNLTFIEENFPKKT